ncbi:class I SAM-dependent methyltransferase [Acholeplasma laidlawii]|uniref:class I SAM-dependent methyltransferase n=1 Tax=Acholeplasma laidlawii TaxID=2148 RepID=UPI003F90FE5A
MSHYFKYDPNLISEETTYQVEMFDQKFTFLSDKGVFSKGHLDTGSYALITNLDIPTHATSLLDVGSGIGVIGIILKKVHPNLDVTQIDINTRELELNIKNNKLNQVETTVYESNLFSHVDKTFDCIVSNPPIRTGKATIYNLYKDDYKHLNTSGQLWIVVRKDQGAKSTIDYLSTIYEEVELVKRHKGFYVICAQKR